MKAVLLLFAVLVAAASAMPERPPAGMRFDPRLAGRRPHGPEGSGFGPMWHFRPKFAFGHRPWPRDDYRPRPPFLPHHGDGPMQHRGPKEAVHGKPASPHEHAQKAAHRASKHGAKPVHQSQHKIVHKPVPHSKVPQKPVLHKHPTGVPKHVHVPKPRILFHKKPAIHVPMKTGPRKPIVHHKPYGMQGETEYGPPKVVYIYVPYCPGKQPYGPRQLFSPLLPFAPPMYEREAAYGPDPIFPDSYRPGYQEVDLDEPYGDSFYDEPYDKEVNYAPDTYKLNLEKGAYPHIPNIYTSPTYNHNLDHGAPLYSQKLYPEPKYGAKVEHKSVKPAAVVKHDLNYMEPVGFSRTEKHYARKPTIYKPKQKYIPKQTQSKPSNYKPWNYIPDIKDFEPGTKFPEKPNAKLPFPDKLNLDYHRGSVGLP